MEEAKDIDINTAGPGGDTVGRGGASSASPDPAHPCSGPAPGLWMLTPCHSQGGTLAWIASAQSAPMRAPDHEISRDLQGKRHSS